MIKNMEYPYNPLGGLYGYFFADIIGVVEIRSEVFEHAFIYMEKIGADDTGSVRYYNFIISADSSVIRGYH